VNILANREQLGVEGAAPAANRPGQDAAAQRPFCAWLEFQARSIAGSLSAVVVLGPADTGPYAPVAFWPGHLAGVPRLADAAERALADRQPVVAILEPLPDAQRRMLRAHGLALPIEVDGHLHGAVALELSERSDGELQQALQGLQWGMAWAEAYFRRQLQQEAAGAEERLMAVLDLAASVLEEEKFEAACRSLVTELAMRLQCDRVSIGVIRRGHAEVVALSHSAQIGKRMDLVRAVGAAMDEAIDQKAVIRYPAAADDEIVVTRDHERLAGEHGNGSLLTVPMAGSGDFAAALTCERPARMPFEKADLALCQSVAAVVTRILELKQRNERALALRVKDACQEQLRRLVGPRYYKRKLVLGMAVLATVFFSVATGDYRVTAPATLEGAVRRALAAPFDGYIASAQVRAGDVARADAVLATLDDRDLRLERTKWASQYAQYLKQHQEAVANRDRAKAQIVQALYEQAAAQVNLLDEQLSRAALRAPFDGVIVKGDLSQSLGAGVKRGDVLFEITPLQSYRVIVEVDEREIADVAPGQKGSLILASIADQSYPFTVTSVTSVTTAREGRNYFRVEAMMDQAGERLRPGMEGVGKIEVERRRLLWIWTHRLVDWMRLFVWTHLP
jgi:RND family efflux transporter MFP subunit